MKTKKKIKITKKFAVLLTLILLNNLVLSKEAPILQPGSPGEPSKILDEKSATDIANTSYIHADISFLRGMIIHHEQAILMASMITERTNNKKIVDLGKRIDVSQKDEIKLKNLPFF